MDAQPFLIQDTQTVLSGRISLFGSLAKPFGGCGIVFLLIKGNQAEIVLGEDVPIFSRTLIPDGRLCEILVTPKPFS